MKHTKAISQKQQAIIDFIDSYTFDNQYTPTIKEIADAMGHSSLSTTHSFIWRLQERDLLQWKRYQPRTLVLTRKGMDQVTKKPINKGRF